MPVANGVKGRSGDSAVHKVPVMQDTVQFVLNQSCARSAGTSELMTKLMLPHVQQRKDIINSEVRMT